MRPRGVTRNRPVEAGVVAFAVLGAVASVGVLLDEFGLAVRAFLLLFGLGFLGGGVLSGTEAIQRGHQALRFAITPTHSAAERPLPDGRSWIRLTGTASATDEDGDEAVQSAFGESALAATTRLATRERFAGAPWPSTETGLSVEETDSVAFAVGPTTLELDADCRVVGARTETLTARDADAPGDGLSRKAVDAVRSYAGARGVELDAAVFRGSLFEHVLRVRESAVRPGDTVSVFGRVRVERDGDGSVSVVRPAGRFENRPLISATGWRPVVRRFARRLFVTVTLSVLSLAGGAYLLWLVGVGR